MPAGLLVHNAAAIADCASSPRRDCVLRYVLEDVRSQDFVDERLLPGAAFTAACGGTAYSPATAFACTTAAMRADQRGFGVLRRICRARIRVSGVPLDGATDPVNE